MTENEKAARAIIDKKLELNTTLRVAKGFFGPNIRYGLVVLTLTDQECANIATNYPLSYREIRGAFDKEI